MRRAAFLDLTSLTKDRRGGTLYLFHAVSGTYELDKSLPYPGGVPAFNTDPVDEVVLGLPLELLNFRVLKLPFGEREKLMKVIPFELENLILEDSGAVVFDATVLGNSGESFDVLVTYIRSGVLREIIEDLSSRGLDPGGVTSLELREALRKGTEDVAPRLVNPEKLGPDERPKAAADELMNPSINLRTGPLASTRDLEKARKSLKVTAILVIVLAVLINAYLVFGIVTSRGEASSLRRELRNTYGALFPNEKKITDELYQMKSHMKEVREKGDALIGVQPLPFLMELSRKIPRGTALQEMVLDRDLITLKGEASSMDDIDKARAGFSEFLRDVSVSEMKPSSGGKTFFTLVAKGRK